VVVVVSDNGGVGKSAVAATIAVRLAEGGLHVLLITYDSQHDA
jgi:cellulose biosynthesis protein BcsQ